MRSSSLSWVLPLVLALTLHYVRASSDAEAQGAAAAQEGETDDAPARTKRGLNMLRLGRGLQMLRLGKRGGPDFEGQDFDYSWNFDPLLFQMLMEESAEPMEEDSGLGYEGYYTPDADDQGLRYRRSLDDDMPYSDEDFATDSFEGEGEDEKRALGMLRLGKRPMGMLRLGKRQLGMLRLGKRQLGMLRLGKRPMGMLRLGKRPMGMLRLGKRPMGMLRLGKRHMGMLRLGKRHMGMLRLGKRHMGMLRLGKREDDADLKEDKRHMGMLRLGKKDDAGAAAGAEGEDVDKRQLGMLRLGRSSQ